MSSLYKKVRDNNDKRVLKQAFGRTPKHRCPVCHRFSLWVPNKDTGKPECVMCELIRRTREERANDKIRNTESKDTGE